MKEFCLPIVGLGFLFAGCSPTAPPTVPKVVHVKEVLASIAKAGGETNVLNESSELFLRFAKQSKRDQRYEVEDKIFAGLPGVTNLGDVFTYATYESNRIEVRIHNSHFDTYHIYLINPNLPKPKGFEPIAGNVGFIEQ